MSGKILLADDSNVAQRMGKEILSTEGFEVVTVSNGQAALKKLKDFLPDLILADIFMPGSSGYELCQFVKSQVKLRHVPVVLLVGAMEPYDAQEGRKVKADGVITKPLQSSNLVSMVKDLLPAIEAAAPEPPAPAAVEESPAQEAPPEETYEEPLPEPAPAESMSAPETIEVPEEMADQPLTGFGNLLDAPVERPETSVEASEAVPEVESAEASGSEIPFPVPSSDAELETSEIPFALQFSTVEAEPATPPPSEPPAAYDEPPAVSVTDQLEGEIELAPTTNEAAGETAEPAELQPSLDEGQELPPAGLHEPAGDAVAQEPQVVWTVEAAEVTEEDRKLFEEPPDWEAIVKMVEAGGAELDVTPASDANLPGENTAPINAEEATKSFAELLEESFARHAVENIAVEPGDAENAAIVEPVEAGEETSLARISPANELTWVGEEQPAAADLVGAEAPETISEAAECRQESTVTATAIDSETQVPESGFASGSEEPATAAPLASEEVLAQEPLESESDAAEPELAGQAAAEAPVEAEPLQIDAVLIEQLVRESMEKIMPELIDDIVGRLGRSLQKEEQ